MQVLILLLSLTLIPGYAMAEEEEGTEQAIEYLEMKPKFTVNLAERKKYLMVNVQLMVKGEERIDKIMKHFPALRHQVIMLLSGLPSVELQTVPQREKLRQQALQKMRETLDKYDNSEDLMDLFFTEFLVN